MLIFLLVKKEEPLMMAVLRRRRSMCRRPADPAAGRQGLPRPDSPSRRRCPHRFDVWTRGQGACGQPEGYRDRPGPDSTRRRRGHIPAHIFSGRGIPVPARWRRPAASRPDPPPAVRACRRRGAGRDGGAGAAELAVAMPLLMLLLLAIVQFALWQYSVHVAASAARQAAEAARARGAAGDAGQSRARVVLDQLGRTVLVDPRVAVDTGAETVTVRITGHAVSLIPGLAPRVDVRTSGVIERFRPATAAGGTP
jgi:hypothetical protein